MKRLLSLLLVLLSLPSSGSAEGPLSRLFSGNLIVGEALPTEAVTDFYYTLDASTNPPFYQRYRFYVEDGQRFFYHETREGGGWPQTEADITRSGTVALTDEQWAAFCDCIRGGAASKREEHLESGDAGPWLYIYWTDGEKEGREFAFASPEQRLAFEAFCEGLREEQTMRISVTDGTRTVIYQLNGSPSAKSLYAMLPLDVEVENYGRNEKIFYPEQALDTADGIEGGGEAGALALFSPWGNVVMYYDSFGAYPGLYLLGQAVEGADLIRDLSGTVHLEILR